MQFIVAEIGASCGIIYAVFLPSVSGMICTSKFGAFAIIFSVRVGLENILFQVAELLPITIFETPESLANSAI